MVSIGVSGVTSALNQRADAYESRALALASRTAALPERVANSLATAAINNAHAIADNAAAQALGLGLGFGVDTFGTIGEATEALGVGVVGDVTGVTAGLVGGLVADAFGAIGLGETATAVNDHFSGLQDRAMADLKATAANNPVAQTALKGVEAVDSFVGQVKDSIDAVADLGIGLVGDVEATVASVDQAVEEGVETATQAATAKAAGLVGTVGDAVTGALADAADALSGEEADALADAAADAADAADADANPANPADADTDGTEGDGTEGDGKEGNGGDEDEDPECIEKEVLAALDPSWPMKCCRFQPSPNRLGGLLFHANGELPISGTGFIWSRPSS